jgi:hypothetical protein
MTLLIFTVGASYSNTDKGPIVALLDGPGLFLNYCVPTENNFSNSLIVSG